MQATTEQHRSTTQPRRTWTRPRIECLESRPEVTAYSGAGDDGPWRPAPGER